MKKKLIAICLSAFMFTSVTSINCMAENPYPDEESYSNSSFAILQDILKMVPSWMQAVMKSLLSFLLRTGRSTYTPLR